MNRLIPAGFVFVALLSSSEAWSVEDHRSELMNSLAAREQRHSRFEVEWIVMLSKPGIDDPEVIEYALKFDGRKFSYWRNNVSLMNPRTGDLSVSSRRITDNGTERRRLISTPDGHTGSLRKTPTSLLPTIPTFAGEPGVLPMLLWFRPLFTELHGWAPQTAELTADDRSIRLRDEDSFQAMCFDPNNKLRPMRWEKFTHTQYSIEFQYTEESEIEAVTPACWGSSRLESDEVVSTVWSATVTKFNPNPEFTESDFTVEFPFGTPVMDRRFGGAQFVARQDGSLRPVAPGETTSGSGWEELAMLPTLAEVANLDQRERHTRSDWIWVLIVAAVLILVTVRLLRSGYHAF